MLNCCIERKLAREERLLQQGASRFSDSSPTDTSQPDGISEASSQDTESKQDKEDKPNNETDDKGQERIVTRISVTRNDTDSEDEFFESCDDLTPETEQGSNTVTAASSGKRKDTASKSSDGDGGEMESETSKADKEEDEVFQEEKEEVKEKETDDRQHVGRLTQCGELMLVHRDEPLYIPITQVKYFVSGWMINVCTLIKCDV